VQAEHLSKVIQKLFAGSVLIAALFGCDSNDSWRVSTDSSHAAGATVDSESGAAIGVVAVSVDETGQTVLTREDGSFELEFPTDLDEVTLRVEGYGAIRYPIPRETEHFALTLLLQDGEIRGIEYQDGPARSALDRLQ
jgi:hypothetical protein